ncbi:uncharacterized protein LOC110377137 [Helicoverpa armigera]|uniref:uncharacterized protein LOC110377137 n=1 Tax=Helicoverpa armigera TaxID=29058 RepID=UPI003082AC89
MFAKDIELLIFFMIIYVSQCQRRIKDGVEVVESKTYVVYLVKAPISLVAYDYWLCGGAIVSSEFVITSAACVHDVDYLYVVAGYKKYVQDSELETDKCTSKMKKKIIYTCSPKHYELKYGELDYWSHIDVALVRVESPFNFNDTNYETLCSYRPTTIPINYELKYQEPGTDALVLGWGHKEKWRKPGDNTNYNSEFLRYAPTLLLNKTECNQHYEDYKNMSDVIDRYMICSLGKGNIDDGGNTIQKSLPVENGCTSKQQKVLGFEGVSCELPSTEDVSEEDGRRNAKKLKQINGSSTEVLNDTYLLDMIDDPRRSGICQNDHGGPLVTWAGAREILIGIASVFKVSDELECMGPYLYTSTLCVGAFLECILVSESLPDMKKTSRRSRRNDMCDKPPSERGYDTVEKYISWKDHPAGPADNERVGRASIPKPFNKYSAGAQSDGQSDYESNEMHHKLSALREHNVGYHFDMFRNPPKVDRYPKKEEYPPKQEYPQYNQPPQSMGIPPPNVRNPPHTVRNPPLNYGNQQSNSWNPPANVRYTGTNYYPANVRYTTRNPRGINVMVPPKAPGGKMYPGTGWHPANRAPQKAPPKNPYPMRALRPLRN